MYLTDCQEIKIRSVEYNLSEISTYKYLFTIKLRRRFICGSIYKFIAISRAIMTYLTDYFISITIPFYQEEHSIRLITFCLFKNFHL